MGGSKGDRKSYKGTSAAKAAEALAAKGVGAGFGGFSGAQPVAGFGFGAPAATSHAASDPVESAAQLDSELAQCLRHLSKRDTTTKLKALQGLDELIRQKNPAELTVMLQPWTYHFKRLLMDNAKAVRVSATAVMAALAAAIGKALAPQLKSLFGPWLVASFDPYPDAAAAAKRLMAEVFPGRKHLDALVFCRTDVLAHIASCLAATPQSLGDPLKETPEELQERHERVLSASLSAAAAVLTTLQQGAGRQQQQQGDVQQDPNPSTSSTVATAGAVTAAVLQEVHQQVAGLMSAPGFFKHKLGNKSALVQRAAYGFVQSVCRTAPDLMSPCLSAAAPTVFSSLQDKEPSNHAAMWEMLLAFVSSQKPACWDAVNVQKAVVPRLLSLLRHGCYGSSVTSLPAVLPFLTQLPQSALAMQPVLLLDQVLESIWIGQGQQAAVAARADGNASAAVTAAYQECLGWGLRHAVTLASAPETSADMRSSAESVDAVMAASSSSSSSSVETYCRQLLQTGHFSSLLQQSLGGMHPNANLAAGIVQAVLLQQCSAYSSKDLSSTAAVGSTTAASSMPVQLQVLCASVGSQVRAALLRTCQQQQQHAHKSKVRTAEAASDAQTAAEADVVCMRVQQMLEVYVTSTGDFSEAAAEHLATACCQTLVPMVQAGQHLPGPASSVLARLIREYPLATKTSSPPTATTAEAMQASSSILPTGDHAGVSSIPALVKLGVSSCVSDAAPSAAQLELLLSCLIGNSSTSTAWAVLLDAVNSAGQTSAAWRFLNALLQQATSSSQLSLSAATAQDGSTASEDTVAFHHPLLDAYILQLLQHLKTHGAISCPGEMAQQQASVDSAVACVDAVGPIGQVTPIQSTAAAAALLATCLGANQQQNVLLGPQAMHECLHIMSASLSPIQPGCSSPDGAVVPTINALCQTLDSSNHMDCSVTGTAPDSGSSRGLWQQYSAQVVPLLLLIWQLAWAAPHDSLYDMMTALQDGSSTTGSTDAYSSSSSLADSSSLSEDDLTLATAAGGVDEGTEGATKQVSVQQDREVAPTPAQHVWQAVHAAAGKAWDSTMLSAVFAALPEAANKQLTEQLQQILVLQVSSAVADLHSADGSAFDAAVCVGTRLALRTAVALEALQEYGDAQQELLQAVLSATDKWPRQSSSSWSGSVQEWPAAHAMMLQLSAVLVLQAGPDLVMPLHQACTGLQCDSNAAITAVHSSSSASSCSSSHLASQAQCSRVWLRLQLSSACSALEQPTSSNSALHCEPSSSSSVMLPEAGFAMAIKKAASEAQQHLIKAAGKGASGAASSAAQSQLLQVLAELLDSACASNPLADKSSKQPHGPSSDATALLHLLSQIVAATAAASPDVKPRFLSVLQQFTCHDVKRAVESVIGRSHSTDPKSQNTIPELAVAQQTSVLVGALQWCAGALRFSCGQDEVLQAAQLPHLSIHIMQEAIHTSAAHEVWPAVQLAIACFPTRAPHTQEQHVPASTPSERQALAALLREVCSIHRPKDSTGSSAHTNEATVAAQAQLKCQLQLCCVSYCWAEMMAAEWHIVLRDAQQQLMSARRGLEKAASNLAGAVCSAAQQLMGSRDDSSSSTEVMSASMAIQLLRRLQQRSLLQKQPAVAQVLKDAVAAAAQQLSELSLLHVTLQVLAAVLLLKEQVQAAGRAPQLDLALAAAFRELLSLLLAIGAAVAVAGCCGEDGSSVMMPHCGSQKELWELLQHCLHGCSAAAGDSVGKALHAADAKMEMLGVDAVAACLALLQQGQFHSHCHHHHHQHHQQQQLLHQQHPYPSQQQPKPCTMPEADGCEPLQELAWELLLHPASLASITHAVTVAETSNGSAIDQPEYDMCEDAAAYLVKVGIRPEMAAGLTNSKPWQQQVLLWALLLAHMTALQQRSAGQRYLCQALREVPELVPQVLDRVVSIMGLGGSSKGSQAEATGTDGNESGPGPAAPSRLSAAAQAALSSSLQNAGTCGGTARVVLSGCLATSSSAWSMATALCSVGLPHNHSSWRLVAAAVYRAVLCTLPASARTWFNDLRDRTRSTAVEQYTSRHESPALLAAEFAGIKRDAAGSSGEVGGSCSFRVVANAANREITAVLEIEDGATLELVVKLPAAAPLKAPEVDCKNKVGIKENRLRKWLLSIAVFLRNQNQGVLDGIAMWKANLEQEFAGVEACLICFSVISAANGQLPRITCKQCNVKFHPACLYKWFKSSGKSTCPHCSALL